jgi:ammonium transporter
MLKRCCVAFVLALLVAALMHGSVRAADEKASPQVVTKQDLSDAKDEAARSGEIAWMLNSSALVMLMVPGLALFYGGMVRKKNVLATMMQSMVALAVVGVYWIAIGYNLAFGESVQGLFGWSPDKLFFLKGVKVDEMLPNSNIPVYAHVMFQGMFAIITPALISGAVAERIRFGPYCAFLIAWVTLVYCPLAHMVWAMDWWVLFDPKSPAKLGATPVGLLGRLGALDFAGGTVVHIAAGFSGLAAILVLRKRVGYPEHVIHPNSMVLTLFGAGLLWFGWFGFNGGSALGSSTLAVSAFSATQAAAAAAGLSWMAAEWLHRGKPTALGLASGIVAGLVAVTPASGFVYIWGGMTIGLLAGFVCYISAVCLKPVLKYDDSLDAFGVHGVGGFLGAVLTGVFCFKEINSDSVKINGLLGGGGWEQPLIQLKAAVIAASLSFIVSLILVKLVDLTLGFVTDDHSEMLGLDRTEHGETGFDVGPELEMAPERGPAEPRAAVKPPTGQKRYTIIIEGPSADALGKAWSSACEVTDGSSAALKAIYPNLTFVQGNRFRFRGGDPDAMRAHLLDLLKGRLGGGSIRVRVES